MVAESGVRGHAHRLAAVLATRGFGIESLFTSLPFPVLVAFAVITQLGDLWFYILTLGTAYWFGDLVPGSDRRTAAFLLGCVLCAMALSTTLKGLFALPRPPEAGVAVGVERFPEWLQPLYTEAATADRTGFPSGHALGTTLVWGGAALTLAYRRRRRLAAGGLVILLVGASRIALGVHYVVDVLAGWAVGGVALALLLRADADRKPGRAFSLAALVALVGALIDFDTVPLMALGATLGARITWGAVGGDVLRTPASRRSGLLLTVVGLPLLMGSFGYLYSADPGAPFAFVVSALVMAIALALPLVGDTSRERF